MSPSSLPWFRLYSEIVDDDIITLLAFEDRWHFVAILALKCNGMIDKKYPSEGIRNRAIAKKMGLSEDGFLDVVARLIDHGLITKTYQPINWDSRQFKADNSTERVRRHREKKGRKSRPKSPRNSDETLQEHRATVSVTPPDTDTDTETELRAPDGACLPVGIESPFGTDEGGPF